MPRETPDQTIPDRAAVLARLLRRVDKIIRDAAEMDQDREQLRRLLGTPAPTADTAEVSR